MLRIAIQAKGRLNEDSIELLRKAGIRVDDSKRRLVSRAKGCDLEVLYLRDDDIPQAVAMGAADLGIVGLNEVAERQEDVDVALKLGFGTCRLSIAIPKGEEYGGAQWLQGKRIATSYPGILTNFLRQQGVNAKIHRIEGSVEIAPTIGMADAIFDIVSSGATLLSNGLKEADVAMESEAAVIANPSISTEKRDELEALLFRFRSILDSRDMKYVLMNLPSDKLQAAVALMPGMRSPTVLPLAQEGWCSMHSVVPEETLWDTIARLKEIGAEGILVLSLENMIR